MISVSRFGSLLISAVILTCLFVLFTNIAFIFPTYFTLLHNNYVTAMTAEYNNYLTQSDINNTTNAIKSTTMYGNGYITDIKVKAESIPEGYNLVSTAGNIPTGVKNKGHEFRVETSLNFRVKVKIAGNIISDSPVPLKAEKIVLGTRFYNDLND